MGTFWQMYGGVWFGPISPGVAMHFGIYLKNKGIISADQLVAALEAQLKTLPRIGQLALEEGIISPRDIFDVLRAQSETPHQRFGELAIEMGLMTRNELMRLLMIQADRKRPLEDVMVSQGIVSKQQAAAEMAEYRQSLANRLRRKRPAFQDSAGATAWPDPCAALERGNDRRLSCADCGG